MPGRLCAVIVAPPDETQTLPNRDCKVMVER
jgi:hypothetical protein